MLEESVCRIQDKDRREVYRAQLINNMCLCYLQLQQNKQVIDWSDKIDLPCLYRQMRFCNERHELIWNILVKVHLRRALCYEKSEKWHHARVEFCQVKHLDGSNMVASKGLKNVM